jgi:hypothetical protein
MWNFKFELVFEVILMKNSLHNTLTIMNLGIFDFFLFSRRNPINDFS